MNAVNLKVASPELIDQLREVRWKCRTDLKFLCNYVLGMPDVSEELHRPVLDHLQQFPVPTPEQAIEHDKVVNGHWEYTPIRNLMDLEGKRRMLLLDSRGFLKSSINCKAHTIQWIINYPDIAIMVMQSNSDKANLVVSDIKSVFQANERFRAIFPEFCPTKRVWEWGRADSFTVMNRRYSNPRGGVQEHKEPTVMASSIEKGQSGIHVDVIKCSDIVEPSNINGEGLEMVRKNFFLAQNLLVAPQYWIDVEGTRYHFHDLYGKIIEMEEKKPEDLKEWKIFVRGATKRDWGGKPETFTSMEFLMKPEILDKNGFPESRWPSRFPNKYLWNMRQNDPLGYSTQQQQDPRPGGVEIFPVNHQFPRTIEPKTFVQNVRISHIDISVDTAETTGKRSDYTAIVVAGWSSAGKCYIMEIVHGRFMPSEIVDKIVKLCQKYKNRLGRVKIEETGFVRGLMPALRRGMDLGGIHIPVETIKRDNQEGKIERIANTLQPWYMSGDLIFVNGISDGRPPEQWKEYWKRTWDHLLKELREFPAGKNDDILDAISDLFQGKTWFGREQARGFAGQQMDLAMAKLLGVLTDNQAAILGESPSGVPKSGAYGIY